LFEAGSSPSGGEDDAGSTGIAAFTSSKSMGSSSLPEWKPTDLESSTEKPVAGAKKGSGGNLAATLSTCPADAGAGSFDGRRSKHGISVVVWSRASGDGERRRSQPSSSRRYGCLARWPTGERGICRPRQSCAAPLSPSWRWPPPRGDRVRCLAPWLPVRGRSSDGRRRALMLGCQSQGAGPHPSSQSSSRGVWNCG
jgi:hypothetical protein